MYTEEEAKTKWCPFARLMLTVNEGDRPILGVGGVNRYGKDGVDQALGTCIGSQCMAWRWEVPESEFEKMMATRKSVMPASRRGSCGLVSVRA
jgi:hypothetical protein